MSLSVNANNYNAYQPQEPQKNAAKKVAVAATAAAAIGTGIYLAKSGKGAEIASKIKKNLEAYGIGKKILGITDKISETVGKIKEKVSGKVKDLHLGEKAETIKQKVVDSPAYQKAGELKTKAKESIKDLHLGEKAKTIKDTVKEKIHNADIQGKVKGLIEKVKSRITKAA